MRPLQFGRGTVSDIDVVLVVEYLVAILIITDNTLFSDSMARGGPNGNAVLS